MHKVSAPCAAKQAWKWTETNWQAVSPCLVALVRWEYVALKTFKILQSKPSKPNLHHCFSACCAAPARRLIANNNQRAFVLIIEREHWIQMLLLFSSTILICQGDLNGHPSISLCLISFRCAYCADDDSRGHVRRNIILLFWSSCDWFSAASFWRRAVSHEEEKRVTKCVKKCYNVSLPVLWFFEG